jgi:hypothetical protein
MSICSDEIALLVRDLLKNGSRGKYSLTELEVLVIDVIAKNNTYRQASTEHQYTESSFQNAASRLFSELSLVLGVPVNRRNFLDSLKKEQIEVQEVATSSAAIIFDRLEANLWIRSEKAKLISISYHANVFLDLTSYLINYSPHFEVTYCLDVSNKSSSLELLWSLCNSLQLPLPTQKDDRSALLKSISLALKKHKVLLVLRFDRFDDHGDGSTMTLADRTLQAEYAEILATLGLRDSASCLWILDNEPLISGVESDRSLNYQLRSAAQLQTNKHKVLPPRLISIENDVKIVCDILKTYLK